MVNCLNILEIYSIYGIKYPRELMILKMLYGYGIYECEKYGYNTSNLSTKLGLCVSTLQYFW